MDMVDVFLLHFPFIQKAITMLIMILGPVRYTIVVTKARTNNVRDLQLDKLHRFVRKVEGRNCSYCQRIEKRYHDFIEKYKTCSGCKAVFYCTRSCQKRDWRARHRNECNTSII
eukprot:387766_1